MSKPTWSNAFGYSATSAFFLRMSLRYKMVSCGSGCITPRILRGEIVSAMTNRIHDNAQQPSMILPFSSVIEKEFKKTRETHLSKQL